MKRQTTNTPLFIVARTRTPAYEIAKKCNEKLGYGWYSKNCNDLVIYGGDEPYKSDIWRELVFVDIEMVLCQGNTLKVCLEDARKKYHSKDPIVYSFCEEWFRTEGAGYVC